MGDNNSKRQRTTTNEGFKSSFLANTGSLSVALQSSRQGKSKRTSFLGNSQSSTFSDMGSNSQKSISFSHVIFQSCGDSQLSRGASQLNSQKSFGSNLPGLGARNGRRPGNARSSSLWSKVMTNGPQKKR